MILKKVRLAYAHIAEPTKAPGAEKAKYSAVIVIDKQDAETVKAVEAAIKAAANAGKDKFGAKYKAAKTPLRDGDDEEKEGFEGCMFFSANSLKRPGLVTRDRTPVTDTEDIEDMFYSGAIVNADVNFYPFSVNGNQGIAVGLNNLQFVRDGKRYGGAKPATAVFEALEEDEDEDMPY